MSFSLHTIVHIFTFNIAFFTMESFNKNAPPAPLYGIQPHLPYSVPSLPTTLNDTLHNHNRLVSNWSYRQFMQNNGAQIMKQDTMSFYQSAGLSPYTFSQTPVRVVTEPIYSTSLHDATATAKSPCPVSDLKRDYLEKVQFQARKVAPVVWVDTPNPRHYDRGFARVTPSK